MNESNEIDHSTSEGPVSTLPGSVSRPVCGMKCDRCQHAATIRVQGETDSFGCEYLHLCDDHYEAYKTEVKENPLSGRCDWCGVDALLKATRDPDEGMSGPVYEVCQDCRIKMYDRLREEMGDCDDFDED